MREPERLKHAVLRDAVEQTMPRAPHPIRGSKQARGVPEVKRAHTPRMRGIDREYGGEELSWSERIAAVMSAW